MTMGNGGMNPLMMMMMMSGMNGDKEGGGGMDLSALVGMFGAQEATVESVWEDAVTFGTARDRNGDATIGVLEARIIPPHAEDPVPRVIIKTNGIIMSRPTDFKKISAVFAKMADDPNMLDAFAAVSTDEAIAEAERAAQEKRNSAMIAPMLGMNGG